MIIAIMIFLFWYLCVMFASGLIMISDRIYLNQKGKLLDCHCDYCGKIITPRWLCNFPLINFIYLKGKSNCCNLRITILHPICEFSLGTLIFVLISVIWGV
jgi:leader peptidase (prepilin peptidase)/N-methyltransferase